MFKEILKVWKEQAFSSRIVDDFVFMLNSSEEMLSYAFKTLTKKGKAKEIEKNIYLKDQSINIKERDIRKQVLVHLAANPGCNLPACLALISISKDAERLGDYIKNIIELKELLKDTKSDRRLFELLFNENGEKLLHLLATVREAFRKSDKELATQAVRSGFEISRRCEEIIDEVLDSEDYSNRQAVVLALGARYMKRIALHLANIATSVTNPLPDVDYRTT